MHRNDHPTAPGGVHNKGDAARGTPPTVVTHDLMNALQEEIAHTVEAFLGPLDKADNYQLKKAIEKTIGTSINNSIGNGDYVKRPELGNAAFKDVGTGANQVAVGNHGHADLVKRNELGDAAFKNTGTAANQVAAGDHVHWDLINAVLPLGVPIPWPTMNPPSGYVAMAGQAFNTQVYPGLAWVYPSGVLPDLRGEFIQGWDAGRGVDPGRGLLSWAPDQFQNHTHFSLTAEYHYKGGNGYGGEGIGFGPANAASAVSGRAGNETKPRSVAFYYICRAL